jgi:hypothetical protein
MAKANNNDPNNPDLSAFKNLSDSQIQSMLMSRAGTPLSPSQAQGLVAFYKQNPGQLASMNIGGTYTPNAPGGYGQQGLSGGITTGGMSGLDFANLVAGFAPQPQQQQQAQQPQMPQLAPRQPMPTVQTTPLTATSQSQSAATPATTMNVPQANAANTAPLFSLGQLPQAQNPLIQPPTQQFQ